MDWRDGFTKANGIRVHYRRTANMNLPAVLLLHGATDNAMCWVRTARALSDRFSVMMVDARGHGRSDGISGGFSLPILAEDAAGVIRSMKLARPIVFGHSMGAATAAALAAEHPDLMRAVVLEDPPLEVPAGHAAGWKSHLEAEKKLPRAARRARIAADNPHWDASEVDPLVRAWEEVDPVVLDSLKDLRLWSWRESFSRFQCPALLLTGDPSRGAIVRQETAEEASRIAKGLQISHIKGAGHCIHRDRWEDAIQAIRAFMLRV